MQISEATVEDVQVREIRTRSSHYFVTELAYSYVVNGDYFSGRFTRDFAREQEAWDYANSFRRAKVVVRHHPEHFERSKLDATPGSAM